MENEKKITEVTTDETSTPKVLSQADSLFKKIKSIISSIVGAVLGILLVYAIYMGFIGNYKMDKFIDQVSFRNYSSLSLADSLQRFDTAGTWDFSVNSTKKIQIGSTEAAIWSGHGDICYEDGTVETVPVTVAFNVFTEDKETTSIELDACTVNGFSWSMDDDNALGAQNIFQVVMSDTPISTDLAIADASSFLGFEMISFAQEGYFDGGNMNQSIGTSDSYEDMYGNIDNSSPNNVYDDSNYIPNGETIAPDASDRSPNDNENSDTTEGTAPISKTWANWHSEAYNEIDLTLTYYPDSGSYDVYLTFLDNEGIPSGGLGFDALTDGDDVYALLFNQNTTDATGYSGYEFTFYDYGNGLAELVCYSNDPYLSALAGSYELI